MTPAEFKQARHALRLTIAQMATVLDVDPRTVRKWEALHGGSARPPNPVAARAVAWFLDGFRPPEWPKNQQTTKGEDTMDDHELTEESVAKFCKALARLPNDGIGDLFITAGDLLQGRAEMLADGMAAGMRQALEADGGRRVFCIWYDDDSTRVTLSWPTNEMPDRAMQHSVLQSVWSALTPNSSD
jgi:transcriptional regulator with XRE-family HTH domain